MSPMPYGSAYRQRRAELLAAQPWCVYCGEPATIADHDPPLSQHRHQSGVGCCRLVASCRRCSLRQAGELGGSRQRR